MADNSNEREEQIRDVLRIREDAGFWGTFGTEGVTPAVIPGLKKAWIVVMNSFIGAFHTGVCGAVDDFKKLFSGSKIVKNLLAQFFRARQDESVEQWLYKQKNILVSAEKTALADFLRFSALKKFFEIIC